MSIDVTEHEGDAAAWNDLVERSPESTVFHRDAFLEAIRRHTSTRVERLVGRKGQEEVGILPVFVLSKVGVRTAFSPPPGMGVPFVGPARLNHGTLRRRKLDKRTHGFVEGAIDHVEETVNPKYWRLVLPPGYDDPRPFEWNDFRASPLHTFHVDLERDEERILDSFSKSVRRYLDLDEEDAQRVEIFEGGADEIEFIHEQVAARYEAQDREYKVPLEYLVDLHESLPPGTVRPYAGTVDGELVSGILTLESDDTIYYSEGGGKPDVDFPINELLHWHIIRDARARGVGTYDMHGANTERIARYKAKFNPELRTYFAVENGTAPMKAVARAYEVFR